MWHDDVISLIAFQLLTYPNANSRLGGESLPKFSRNATFGLRIQWRWSHALEMASLAKKRILNFWVNPKKDLENLFTLVVTPRDLRLIPYCFAFARCVFEIVMLSEFRGLLLLIMRLAAIMLPTKVYCFSHSHAVVCKPFAMNNNNNVNMIMTKLWIKRLQHFPTLITIL